jgi:NAD(P)-dependent dehydrogenase (short-subunit alcohol dehydrogenase family)
MKIAITGHTQGIGKRLAEYFSNNAEVIGLSRSNGYDINNTNSIIDAVKDCDVFINNAYSDYQQAILLEAVYRLWEDTNKTIINIGSTVTNYPRTEITLDNEPWPYRDHKLALQKKFRELSWNSTHCHLALVNPGATDTPLIKHLDCIKLAPAEIVEAVALTLANPYIKEITVYAK